MTKIDNKYRIMIIEAKKLGGYMTVIEEATMKSVQGIYKKLPDLNGMTLRDLFAMSSLNGLIYDVGINEENVQMYANKAYLIADAMLEARK